MKQTITKITLGMILFGGGYIAGNRTLVSVHAQHSVNIDRSWGHCVGSIGNNLIFEASDGTVRVFGNAGTTEYRRQ